MVNYEIDGAMHTENRVPEHLILAYLARYGPLFEGNASQHSYLPSRDEYKDSQEIMAIINSEAVCELVLRAGSGFSPMLAEARTHSSRIYWHRDCNSNDKDAANSYLGVIIALEDAEADAGQFEYIPGSHLWQVDESMINETNIRTREEDCYEYYRGMVSAKGVPPVQFQHSSGSVMLWHGHTLHRGDENNGKRHSLTIHFTR